MSPRPFARRELLARLRSHPGEARGHWIRVHRPAMACRFEVTLASEDPQGAQRTLRLSARGGSSEIRGHGHTDLLSFKCMVNGERMIVDQTDRNAVAFTGRGHHLYGRSIASKNTIG